jgi:hypothetical protein
MGSLEGVISCRVRRLFVCYNVTLFYKQYFYDIFPPCKVIIKGRAIAQAVSRWLPTAAAQVQTRV